MLYTDLCSDPIMLPDEAKRNLLELADVLTHLEAIYGQRLKVNSGYRTPQEHAAIYLKLNAARKLKKLEPLPVPLGSAHLKGLAADLNDPNKTLQTWILEHVEVLEDLGIYCERFEFCQIPSPWAHCQIVPPRSGKRFFIP